MLFHFLLYFFPLSGVVYCNELISPPQDCQESCISTYDGSQEDACLRGCNLCQVSFVKAFGLVLNCRQLCADTYPTTDLIESCFYGCGKQKTLLITKHITAIHNQLPRIAFKIMNNIRGLFVSNLLKSASSNSLQSKSEINNASDNVAHVFITRVRIFRNMLNTDFISDLIQKLRKREKPNLKQVNFFPAGEPIEAVPIKPFKPIAEEKPQHYSQTLSGKVVYFYQYAASRPLILLIVMLVIICLLTLRLLIHSCQSRDRRHYQYTRLPNYVEVVDTKLPLYDDVVTKGNETEKCVV